MNIANPNTTLFTTDFRSIVVNKRLGKALVISSQNQDIYHRLGILAAKMMSLFEIALSLELKITRFEQNFSARKPYNGICPRNCPHIGSDYMTSTRYHEYRAIFTRVPNNQA